jgi:hypothetical protein
MHMHRRPLLSRACMHARPRALLLPPFPASTPPLAPFSGGVRAIHVVWGTADRRLRLFFCRVLQAGDVDKGDRYGDASGLGDINDKYFGTGELYVSFPLCACTVNPSRVSHTSLGGAKRPAFARSKTCACAFWQAHSLALGAPSLMPLCACVRV